MTIREAIVVAKLKGYRVDTKGRVISPSGLVRKTRRKRHNRKHPGYEYVNIWARGRSCSIPVHRLAAYQRWGPRTFDRGVEVLHRGRDSFDNRPQVLFLGTRTENEHDKKRARQRAGS